MKINKNIIKLLICLFIVIILVFILLKACSKKTIIGSWRYEKNDYIYTFNEDGTGNYYAIGTVMSFTYTVDKEKISILYKGEDKPIEVTYKLKGKKLIVDDSLGEGTIYIRQNKKETK